ncbi:MAG: hypothetical protein IJS08_10875 [Victivallales bacterium]|nr:hypothetical protein [Victivallales bacterium]
MMNRISIIVLFCCLHLMAIKCISNDIFQEYFKSVECNDAGIIISFKSQGPRFTLKKNESSMGVSHYDQVIEISNGDTISFIDRHFSMTIEMHFYNELTEEQKVILTSLSLSPPYLCEIKHTKDYRSFGRYISNKTYYLVPIFKNTHVPTELLSHLSSSKNYLFIPKQKQNIVLEDYYYDFDCYFKGGDVNGLCLLLEQFDSYKEITFGRGFGPNDRNEHQIRLLNAIKSLKDNMTFENVPISGEKSKNQWFKFLSVLPNDIISIATMIKHTEAAVRYCALLKIEKQPYNEGYASLLHEMVKHDPYIVIRGTAPQLKKGEKSNGLPYNGRVGYVESCFASPTRQKAAHILSQWEGKEVVLNQEQLARDGVLALVRLYRQSDEEIQRRIIMAVNMFTVDTLPYDTVLNFEEPDVSKEDWEIILLFKKHLLSKSKTPQMQSE